VARLSTKARFARLHSAHRPTLRTAVPGASITTVIEASGVDGEASDRRIESPPACCVWPCGVAAPRSFVSKSLNSRRWCGGGFNPPCKAALPLPRASSQRCLSREAAAPSGSKAGFCLSSQAAASDQPRLRLAGLVGHTSSSGTEALREALWPPRGWGSSLVRSPLQDGYRKSALRGEAADPGGGSVLEDCSFVRSHSLSSSRATPIEGPGRFEDHDEQ
jgi:hypothetical protein